MELAYRAISTRERTVAEVRAFLERKELEAASIDYALAELAEAGAVDDMRFARLFVEAKRLIERWGKERIARELNRRGITAELIEAATADQDRDGELQAALELLEEKVAPPQGDRERDKAWRMLVRKGYEPDLAYEAVRARAGQSVG
ncbi:MAG: regulatory protein RecX [Thermoleophilaceae bacterium]